jgi:hypothetical protein
VIGPDQLRLLLIAGSVVLVFILARALSTGAIHSQFEVTHRERSPGTFWALWLVLAAPLIPILLVISKLKGHP